MLPALSAVALVTMLPWMLLRWPHAHVVLHSVLPKGPLRPKLWLPVLLVVAPLIVRGLQDALVVEWQLLEALPLLLLLLLTFLPHLLFLVLHLESCQLMKAKMMRARRTTQDLCSMACTAGSRNIDYLNFPS